MSVERRIRLTPDERRAQLVAAGVNFLSDHPLDELTIDELAERAGVSRALIFHYFETRQGMHRAVVTTARDALLTATAPRPELPARERVHDTLERIATFVREHRGTFFSLVRGVASGDPAVRAVVDESREKNAAHLLEALLEVGEPDSRALRITLRAWVSFAEEIFVTLAVDDDADRDAVVAFLERSLEAAVAAARGAEL
ncbi:TetR/AcrR family transcriptional regulator [Microbacterium bovistercoris]|uniref:TetR/AcrR family transcriptional regulator n=1 Tax=Microbacterium bovistercoris TaxID=2293570 RepID=A0A371NSM7_9MICO|nr:TetR/AcrR family transcriptional regulator [Microbacterium bovistercoris]REJ04615.1 TetR/AcrR family transcriptional regulator [Microbacterium bovistercoris]